MKLLSRRGFIGGAVASSAAMLLPNSGVAAEGANVKKSVNSAFKLNLGETTVDGQFPFSKKEYQQRVDRTRSLMHKAGIDTLYVTSPEGLCYYSGYSATWYRAHSPSGWPALAALVIHVNDSDPIFFDTTEEEYVHKETSILDPIWIPDDLFNANLNGGVQFITKELKSRGWTKGVLAMEMMSYVPNPLISNTLSSAFQKAGAKVIDGSLLIRGARKIKSPQELKYIRQAAKIADIGIQAVKDSFYPGVTPLELHGAGLEAMLAAGGEMPGINQGVISGPNASAHNNSSRRPIKKGESFGVDFSGVVNRYHANICRSFVAGEPSKDTLKMSKASGEGIKLLCKYAKHGANINEVKKTIVEYYKENGAWDHRQYIGGYELGIAFPPDWVGEWNFDFDVEEDQGIFEKGIASNFESVFAKLDGGLLGLLTMDIAVGVNIDTIIFGDNGAESLSNHDFMPIIVG